jgi:hypothetical protein
MTFFSNPAKISFPHYFDNDEDTIRSSPFPSQTSIGRSGCKRGTDSCRFSAEFSRNY